MMLRLFISLFFVGYLDLAISFAEEHCPFCSAVNLTLSEQLKINDLVVIATLKEGPAATAENSEVKRQFLIKRVFKGENFIAPGESFTTGLKGTHNVGEEFLCWGIGPPQAAWGEPISSHNRIEEYLEELQNLPEKGPDRLVFFQDYFEDSLKVLAADAYDEFAIASYNDLWLMKDRMQRERLVELIRNPKVEENRRRLYLTMLGVCGSSADIVFLESLLTSREPADLRGLDSLVACYLSIKGAEGLALVEKQFLSAEDINYATAQQVIAALRFHGTEVEIVGRDNLILTMRKLLNRQRLADIVIPDLARWEDWTVLDQLVTMFKEPTTNSNWVRVPVFQYLSVCPLPIAKERIEELKLLDLAAYQRARFLSRIHVTNEPDPVDQVTDEEPKAPE